MNSRKETIKEKRKELEKHIKLWIDKNNILKKGEKISVDIKISRPREIAASDQLLGEEDWIKILSLNIWSESQRKVFEIFMEMRRPFLVNEIAVILGGSFTYAMFETINKRLSEAGPYRLQTFKSWGVEWSNCKLRMVIIQGQKD